MRLAAVVLTAMLAGCALKSPPKRDDVLPQSLPNLKVPERWAEPIGHAAAHFAAKAVTTTASR